MRSVKLISSNGAMAEADEAVLDPIRTIIVSEIVSLEAQHCRYRAVAVQVVVVADGEDLG